MYCGKQQRHLKNQQAAIVLVAVIFVRKELFLYVCFLLCAFFGKEDRNTAADWFSSGLGQLDLTLSQVFIFLVNWGNVMKVIRLLG